MCQHLLLILYIEQHYITKDRQMRIRTLVDPLKARCPMISLIQNKPNLGGRVDLVGFESLCMYGHLRGWGQGEEIGY